MAFAVVELLGYLGAPESAAGMSLVLIEAIALGAVVYVAALLLLWALSGLPAGAERQVLDTLKQSARRASKPLTN